MISRPDCKTICLCQRKQMGDWDAAQLLMLSGVGPASHLRAVGIEPEYELARNARHRYVHVRLPDGHRYELIDERV